MRNFDSAYNNMSYPNEFNYTINGWRPEPKTYLEKGNCEIVTPLDTTIIVDINRRIRNNIILPFFYMLEWDVTEVAGGFVLNLMRGVNSLLSDLDIVTVDQDFIKKFKELSGKEESASFKFESHTLYSFDNPGIHILVCNPKYKSTHTYMKENFDMLCCMVSITDTALWCPFPHAYYRAITMSGLSSFKRPGVFERIMKYMVVKGFVADPTVKRWLIENQNYDDITQMFNAPEEFKNRITTPERRVTHYG
jgi:hypothetical protein